MTEQTLYYTYEDKRYRIKVRNDMVFIERHASDAAAAKSADAITLQSYPVIEDRYWVSYEIERLIQFHEADYGPVPSATIEDLEAQYNLIARAQDTSAEDEAWSAYNAALRLDAYPNYHPGFNRVIQAIEQHDPLLIEPDAEHWLAIGRDPSELQAAAQVAQAQCVKNDPECPNTGWPLPCSKCNFCSQNLDEETMEPEPDETLPAVLGLTDFENVPGTFHYDVDQQPVSIEWLEPATEEDLSSQSSDSRDLEDFFDEDDYDEWYD